MTLAVGFFDGIHLGHQAILNGADAVLTFRNHPLSVVAPDRAPALLMSCAERLAALGSSGMRTVTALDFTSELQRRSPEAFAGRYFAAARTGAMRIRCGRNWHFGQGGQAGGAWLAAHDYAVDEVALAEFGGAPVSSSRIRQALADGRLADAQAMLGRAVRVEGTVARGKGLGRRLGFPTLNVAPSFRPPLALGVYEVEAAGARALASYGVAPTVGAAAWREPIWEVHFLSEAVPDASEGDAVTLEVRRFLRPERKFPSLEALTRQIAADVASVRP